MQSTRIFRTSATFGVLLAGAAAAVAQPPGVRMQGGPTVGLLPPTRLADVSAPPALSATSSPSSGAPSISPSGSPTLDRCQVTIIDEAHLSAKEAGTIVEMPAREGMSIAKDALVAKIDDRQAQLDYKAARKEWELAKTQGEDDSPIKLADASLSVSKERLTRVQTIANPSSVFGDYDERELRLTVARDEIGGEKARMEQQLAQMTAEVKALAVAAAEEAVSRRWLRAPFDGMVAETFRNQSEWAEPGEPLVRLVRMDRMYVDGLIRVNQFDPSQLVGKPVTATVIMGGNRPVEFQGVVAMVNPVVENDAYRVRAEVENRKDGSFWLLCPGMDARMTLHVQPQMAQR